MARYLALDWDHNRLQVVAATLRHGVVHMQQAVAWSEEKSPNPADAEALGRLLRERLQAAGIAPAPVLACVGRDRVVLKEIRHPPVPPAEEPALVRFQAIKELTDPPDEVVIDYAPTGEISSEGERRALVLVLRRELLAVYQALCRGAKLKLVGICPRPFGTAACLKQVAGSVPLTPVPDPPDATVAVLTVAPRWAEFCVVRDGQLLFARTLPAPALSGDAALVGEIRRNLAVHAGQVGQQPVRALYVASGEVAVLQQRLQETLAIPVYPLDPFAGSQQPQLSTDNRGPFTGAVGLLHAQAAGRALPINFIQPREPKPVRDPNQGRLLVGGLIAALLLIGLVMFSYAMLSARDREVEALTAQQADLDRRLAQTEEELRRLKALDDWDSRGIVWLDELYDLTDRIPADGSLRLTLLAGDPLPVSAKAKYVAKMTLKGNGNTDRIVDGLVANLNTESHYHAYPPTRDTGPGTSRFTRQFTARVDLLQRPPIEYQRRLAVAPESPRDRRGRGGAGAGFPREMGLEGGLP